MTIKSASPTRGIALIVVMIMIFVLGGLAGLFAKQMHVEAKLARNTRSESDLEWLGRSGVELARYVVGQQVNLTPGFSALNQKWAGGVGNTNDLLAWVSLENNRLGPGSFSIKIRDAERKFNINGANEVLLQQALGLIGVAATDSGTIVDSILDWRDPDDHPHLAGAESDDYYLPSQLHFAKNGPIGDITELLLVRGVTPEIFWGPGGANSMAGARIRGTVSIPIAGFPGSGVAAAGLAELFSTLGGPFVNINTAPAQVLQLIPGVEANVGAAIVQARAGFDGVEGTEDDLPFRNVGELINIPGMNPMFVQQLQRFCQVDSFTFEVQIDAHIDQYQRRFKAMLRRVSPQDVQVLYLHWD